MVGVAKVLEVHTRGTRGVSTVVVCEVGLWGTSVFRAELVCKVSSGGPWVPGTLECLAVGATGGRVVGLFACLVTHFLVLLGIFPGVLVVFSGILGVSLAEGLVASSPGSQASGSLPRPCIQLQLMGSEMESKPGVPGRWRGRQGRWQTP